MVRKARFNVAHHYDIIEKATVPNIAKVPSNGA